MSAIQWNTARRCFLATLLLICYAAVALARPEPVGGAEAAGASILASPQDPPLRAAGLVGGDDDRCRIPSGVGVVGDDTLRWGFERSCRLVRLGVGVLDLTRHYVRALTALLFARPGRPAPVACGGAQPTDATAGVDVTPAPGTAGRCRSG